MTKLRNCQTNYIGFMTRGVQRALKDFSYSLPAAEEEERKELWRTMIRQQPHLVATECFYSLRDDIDFEAIYGDRTQGEVWSKHIEGWLVSAAEIIWNARVSVNKPSEDVTGALGLIVGEPWV